MKYQKMINATAGAVLVLAPLGASATVFGDGWMINKNSGTLYNANAPSVELTAESGKSPSDSYKNSFGGGWAHDKNSGTIHKTDMPTVEQSGQASSGKPADGHKDTSGKIWAKNYMFSPS